MNDLDNLYILLERSEDTLWLELSLSHNVIFPSPRESKRKNHAKEEERKTAR